MCYTRNLVICYALRHCRKNHPSGLPMAFAATALCGSREAEEKAETDDASGRSFPLQLTGFT